MAFASIIQKWFKSKWGGSLMLPDGWYGRPYDAQYALTSLVQADGTLTLVLEGKLTLHFTGLVAVKVEGRDLVLGPFDKFFFEFEPFGNGGERGAKEYRTGEVRIVGAPG